MYNYKLHIDKETFSKKPTPAETSKISERITTDVIASTPEQIAYEVGAKGKTVLLGLMTGKRENKNLAYQQTVALDFDNEAQKGIKNKGNHYTTIEQALADPFIKDNASFLYKTFSHKEEWHKFRVVFFLNEPIRYNEQVNALYTALMAKYNPTDDLGNVLRGTLDIGTKDSARLFYGGIEAIEINYNNTLDINNFDLRAKSKNKPIKSSDTSEISYNNALSLIAKYAERNKERLEDYDFYIMNHNVIRNALITGEINQEIAETCVIILANGNERYGIDNVYKLRNDKSEPKIKKSFKEWYGLTNQNELIEKDVDNNLEKTVLKAQINKDKLLDFYARIDKSVNEPPVATGFKQVDKLLDGGLREGLQVIGAISSLGKTTLVMQVADQIAKQGHDVLIFSLEMGTNELIAKSISRLTLYKTQKDGKPTSNAKAVNEILTGSRYASYSDYEKGLIEDSVIEYSNYSKNLYIHEGTGSTSALEVDRIAKKHKQVTGNTPIIIIDYLQILEALEKYGSDKMNTDKSIKILKQLSRDLQTTVIAISSFNRDNYNTPVSMVSFKESGGIEYSADIVLGLQFSAFSDDKINKKSIDFDKEKAKEPRKVELKILKNRNGETGKSVHFNYYAKYNMYEEVEVSDQYITTDYQRSARVKKTVL